MTDLTEYMRIIHEDIKNKNTELFINKDFKKTNIIIRLFLAEAKKEVCIFSKNLNKVIYDDLTWVVKDIYDRGVNIKVILEEPEVKSTELFEFLKSKNLVKVLGKKLNVSYFVIVDNKMSWIYMPNKKEAIVRTYISSNDITGIKHIETFRTAFEKLWK